MYVNATMRRVRVTIVAVEKQKVLQTLSACSLRYPTCNAHAPSVPCPALQCFFHIIS